MLKMVNAWSLAASVLDGTLDEDYPIMTKAETTITPQESDEYDPPKAKPETVTSLESEDIDPKLDVVTVSSGNTATEPEHSPYYYDYNRNDPDAKNPFTDAFDYAMGEAVVSGNDYPSAFTTLSDNDDQMAHHVGLNYDELNLNIQANSPYNSGYEQEFYKEELKKTMTDSRNKYHENEILKDVEEYVSRTYNGHYTGTKHEYRNVQTIDLMASRDLASDFCQANILKYGSRYGSKDGRNKKDLLKVIHYAMLLLHFDEHYGKPSMTSGNIDHNMP